jgi:phage tail-like protein
MPILRDSKSTIATDPIRSFKFQVNINHELPGMPAGVPQLFWMGFMNMSGLGATTQTITYREGGDNTTLRKMPGQTDFPEITLGRGVIMYTAATWYWFKQLFFVNQGRGTSPAGSNFRADFDVLVLDHPVTQGNTPAKLKFRIYNAWPSALSFSDFDAGGNAALIQQMTLQHEGWDMWWATPDPGATVENVGPQ